MKTMVRVFLLVCLVATLAACQSMGGAFGASQFHPRLNLRVGDAYAAHDSIRMTITVPLGNREGLEINVQQNTEMDTRIEVLERLPRNTWRLSYTIARFRNEMDAMGMHQEFDSAVDTHEGNPLSAMIGHTFVMTLDEESKIIDFTGLDELFDKILERVGPLDHLQRQVLLKSLRESLNEDALKQNMLPNTDLYPGEPVTVGESWTTQYDLRAIVPMSGTGRYTLTKRENDRAFIDVLIDFSDNPNGQPLNFNGMFFAFERGTSTGSLVLDERTGMVVDSHTITDLTMSMDRPPEMPAAAGEPDNLTMRVYMEHNYTMTDADQAETMR